MCGFIGLFSFFLSQFIILFGMLLCWRYPPRFGSLFKTSLLPGDGITRPRAAGLTGTGLASGYEGDRDPRPGPPVHLLSTPGSQLVSGGPRDSGHRKRARPSLGEGLSPRATSLQVSKGSPTQLGAVASSFSLFFLFCPLACPQPEARIIGTGEGAGREDGQTECA